MLTPTKFTTKLFTIITLTAVSSPVVSTATSISFDPSQPLVVSGAGSFTGSTSIDGTYTRARLVFSFFDKTSDPFTITGLSFTGDGISSSLSFNNLVVSGNGLDDDGQFLTNYVNLNSPLASLLFSNNTVSFEIPADSLNVGASFTVGVRYANVNGSQINTSSGGSIYASVIPEPSISLLSAVGMCLFLRRRRCQLA